MRIRLADGPDLMWETLNSIHLLQHRQGALVFDEWRRAAWSALRDGGDAERALQLLFALAPYASYCPDFLTPLGTGPDPEESIEAVLATPAPRIRRELGTLADRVHAPAALTPMASTDAAAMRLLGHALRTYQRAALAPFWPQIRSRVRGDLAMRVRALQDGGSEGLLASLSPTLRWRRPVLATDYPFSRDLHLNGRGLLLIPSFFCWARSITLADPELPPVLVYPIDHAPGWTRRAPSGPVGSDDLEPLLGLTRARLLELVARGRAPTTTGLARVATVSPATVSKHLNVLRRAGLVHSRNDGRFTVHSVTDLGWKLLRRS